MRTSFVTPGRFLLDSFAAGRGHLLPAVAVTGVVGGLIGAAYVTALNLMRGVLFPEHWSRPAHWLVLIAVGITIAVLIKLLGDPGDTELLVNNIHISGGPEGLRSLRSLIPVSLIGIAAGGGIGPEGPLTQISGTVGSWLGQRFQLDKTELRTCTITGMAAGFTVLFASPLGGAVFALEILHRKGLEYYEALIPAVLGALAGYAVYVATTRLGLQPIWSFEEAPKALHLADLGWSVACGFAGAAVAVLFTWLSLFFRAVFRPLPVWAKPVMAAVLLGGVAYVSPYALTFSEYQLASLVTMKSVAVTTLLLAVVGHLLSAPITMAGTWKGGFIIPLFFIGYCLGRAATPFLPGANEIVLATAMMVACNVGVTKTPLASVLVVAGMSGLRLLPTMLIAAVVSLFLTSGVVLLESQRRRESVKGEDVIAEGESPLDHPEEGALAPGA